MKKCLFYIEAMLGIPFDYDNWFEKMEVELTEEQFNQYCDTLVKWKATDEWNKWDDENGHDYFIRRDLPEIYKIVRQKLAEVVPIKWGEQCMEYIDQINIYTPEEIYSAVEWRNGLVRGKFLLNKYNEYLRTYFNRVEGITAVCISKYPLGGDYYSELELGMTYNVVFAGATDCNKILLMLEDFPFKEYNSVCFDIYDNGVRLDYYWDDVRFQSPKTEL